MGTGTQRHLGTCLSATPALVQDMMTSQNWQEAIVFVQLTQTQPVALFYVPKRPCDLPAQFKHLCPEKVALFCSTLQHWKCKPNAATSHKFVCLKFLISIKIPSKGRGSVAMPCATCLGTISCQPQGTQHGGGHWSDPEFPAFLSTALTVSAKGTICS